MMATSKCCRIGLLCLLAVASSRPQELRSRLRRELGQQQTDIRSYHLWKPEKIKDILYEWEGLYPDLVRLTTAQEAYGLPTAGDTKDCPFDSNVDGCLNYILTIQDFEIHPEGSDSSNRLPEVFLSGELHGNERVGPTAVMEAAQLLLEAAACDATPSHRDKSLGNSNSTLWSETLKEAKQCRNDLKAKGTNDVHRKWLARLVSSRRIVIVPTANALGYFRNVREEGSEDPNRDFPYDVKDPADCMKTIAGRTLNEIFREHMFQLSLTFHGGMEVVAYEWGAPTWLGHLSPDDEAEQTIGAAYSQYGGAFQSTKVYDYGTMNDLVYYVRGGFEDWAYAGSWDPDRVVQCQPKSFDGYDAEKTKYEDSTLRVFNMLIETSNDKEPRDSDLGNSLNVFEFNTTGNGHVSRNIRLSLLACDVVQPYLSIVGVNDLTMSDDVVPLLKPESRSCQDTNTVMVPGNKKANLVRWTVGGSFTVDSTVLYYAKWDDVPETVLNCLDQPKKSDIEKYFKKGEITRIEADRGTGFFSKSGSSPIARPSGDTNKLQEALGPVFEASIDVSGEFTTHEKVVVIASARVDQSWTNQPKDIEPQVPPQSHVVNGRTNEEWHHESAGKVIDGRLDWFSAPLTMVVGDYKDSIGNQAGREVGTVELSNRFGETTGGIKGGVTPKGSSTSDRHQTSGFSFLHAVIVVAGVSCLLLGWKQLKSGRQGLAAVSTAEYLDEFHDEDDEFGMPNSYSDKPPNEPEDGVELNNISKKS